MLSADFRTVNSCHEFIVKTDEPDYVDVLVPVGYGPLGDTPGEYLTALRNARAAVERVTRGRRSEIIDWHRQGVEAATPRKRQIRFPTKAKEDKR